MSEQPILSAPALVPGERSEFTVSACAKSKMA